MQVLALKNTLENACTWILVHPYFFQKFSTCSYISYPYLTIFIRRVTLNTELDTECLFARHGQMAHFGVYPLVCPFSIWPRQGFYVELFSINAFASEHQAKMKKTFGLE